MQFTGERMVPGTAGRDELFFEHVVRYAFAARHAPARRVLDAGCGCGYGAHFMRRAGAAEVIGVDRDAASIRFSRRHFGYDGLHFIAGDVRALPMPDASFDVVTCFEVFEHLDSPSRLLAELRRILRPDGVLVLSTPNALTYEADTADGANPYHHREYTPEELQEMLVEHFPAFELFVQNPFGGMGIFPVDRSLDASAAVEMRVLSPPSDSLWGEPREIHAAAEKCAYLIAECGAPEAVPEGRLFAMASDLSDTTLERRELDAYVEALTQEYGLLKDQQASSDEWVRDVLGQLKQATAELERLHQEHASLEEAYNKQEPWLRNLQEEVEEAKRGRRQLESHLRDVSGQLAESTDGRRELEAYLQRVTANLELERKGRRAAEERCGELERQLGELSAPSAEPEAGSSVGRREVELALAEATDWARQLEGELERTRVELEGVRQDHAELEGSQSARAEWALDLEKELEASRRALDAAKVEREKKEEHEKQLQSWAQDLGGQLEKAVAERRETQRRSDEAMTAAEARIRQLEEELSKKDERLEQVEAAYAEVESHEQEMKASLEELRTLHAEGIGAGDERDVWARGLERELAQSQSELERLERLLGERDAVDEERSSWARGLEQELAQSQSELERLERLLGERDAMDEERSSWALGLERELAQSQSELERLGRVLGERDAVDEERSSWARGLERELTRAQSELERRSSELEALVAAGQERDEWAEQLENELESSREETARLRAQITSQEEAEQERDLWARGLEEALLESQSEVERLRAVYEELAKNDAERALWARELERRLIDADEQASGADSGPSLSSVG